MILILDPNSNLDQEISLNPYPYWTLKLYQHPNMNIMNVKMKENIIMNINTNIANNVNKTIGKITNIDLGVNIKIKNMNIKNTNLNTKMNKTKYKNWNKNNCKIM